MVPFQTFCISKRKYSFFPLFSPLYGGRVPAPTGYFSTFILYYHTLFVNGMLTSTFSKIINIQKLSQEIIQNGKNITKNDTDNLISHFIM